MRFLLFLFIPILLLGHTFEDITPSSPEEIASLKASQTVEGFISAISGQPILKETDLIVKGAQDLLLGRIYVAPQLLGQYVASESADKVHLSHALKNLAARGWLVLPHLFAGFNSKSPYFLVRDPQGCVLEFRIKAGIGKLVTSAFGCSNLSQETASAGNDIRNISLWVENKKIFLSWPDGTIRVYSSISGKSRYKLDEEHLPNKKVIRYYYDNIGLTQIASTDVSGKYCYATIDRIGESRFRGSDGREVYFDYQLQRLKGKEKTKNYHKTISFSFPQLDAVSSPFYESKAFYDERSLLGAYDRKAYPLAFTYTKNPQELCRVNTFSTPSGSLSFHYDSPIAGEKGGSTTVSYPNGADVIYRYNQNLLLTAIENHLNGVLCNKKLFFYTKAQHIQKIETIDASGTVILTKTFKCDGCGNPLLETLSGDFGSFTIQRTFSGYRCITEKRDDGLSYEYKYLNNTHLLLSKTVLAYGRAIRKTIYTYDEAYNLIQEEEEGEKITTYHLYEKGPHLHRVKCSEEKDSKGALIHKVLYTYDTYGNLAHEEHYDANDVYAYSIKKTYDEAGNLLNETNSLNQTASYTYDKRGRCISEIPFSNLLTIEKNYDKKGRITLLKEGQHLTKMSYDSLDHIIEKTDYLGHTTTYAYHPVHKLPTKIHSDPLRTEITYDSLGREIETKDAYGASYKTKRNSYGKPTEILHPDGGIETFAYAPNGLLIQRTDPDGLTTEFSYDPLGRIVSEKCGERCFAYAFDAYRLIAELDPLDTITNYTYNSFGQKIAESRSGRETYFTYDPLGYVASESRLDRTIHFKNDVAGRVLVKEIDTALRTEYAYDSAGNISMISNGDPVYLTYDIYNRLNEKTDRLGYKTTISYEESDQTLTKHITDPRGITTVEIYDSHGNLLKREIPGTLLETYTYDNALRLSSQDHLTFSYTPEGFCSSLTEGGQQTTFWNYTPGGKICKKIKPDGKIIDYVYDKQGDLIQIGSRTFEYDSLGRLIGGSGFSRQLDPFDNILQETFSNGLTISSTYDHWNRPLSRTFSDETSILYHYEGPFLKKVDRIGENGEILYTHSYDTYTNKGYLEQETGFFTSSYEYDKAGKKTRQTSPFYEENLIYDPAGNLIQKEDTCYSYDPANQLIAETDSSTALYDTHRNCIRINETDLKVDSLNHIQTLKYDPSGNLLRTGFLYDEFNQLISSENKNYTYDALGRRLTAGNQTFLYLGMEEIGSFVQNKPLELKIPGAITPIALEINNKPYFPIYDVQTTVKILIDPENPSSPLINTCDAFGANPNPQIPYSYVGKRYDTDTDLYYFGSRYYDPYIRRWLSTDPAGPHDHSNLYQYVFNNPFTYCDPSGEAAFLIPFLILGAEITLPTITSIVTPILLGATTTAIGYGAYKAGKSINAYVQERSYDLKLNNYELIQKKGSVDPTLPANPDELLKRPDWIETTHPEAKKNGHRTFENTKTGEVVRHDEGKPEEEGHEKHDHYHKFNPDSTGKKDKYLDDKGTPVPKGSDPSHIYNPEKIWWNL